MAKSVIINGVTYSDVPSVDIPLSSETGDATFYETSADTAVAGDVLSGKTAHSASGPITGTMANNGAVVGDISTVAGKYTIPAGYHNGSGYAEIAPTEQAKIVTGNIKAGVTILGVAGDTAVVDTTVSSGAATAAAIMNGYKAYVNGALVTGSATVPTVSQDSTTKVLTIS